MILRPPLFSENVKPDTTGRLAVNRQHKLSDCLEVGWVGGHTTYGLDAVGNDVQLGATASPTILSSVEGLVTDFASGVGDYLSFGPRLLLKEDEPFSFAIRAKWNNQSYNQCGSFRTDSGVPIQMMFGSAATYSDFWMASRAGGGFIRRASGASTAPFGQWNTVVFTCPSSGWSTVTDSRLYINGAEITPVLGGSTSGGVDDNLIGASDAATRFFNGSIGGLFVWPNRLLTAEEGLELSLGFWAPYGQPLVYDPVSVPYLSIPGAAPANVLTAESGSYNYTGYDATLTGPSGSTMVAEAGSYGYTGYDADLLVNRYMVADSGSYAYTGYDAGLSTTRGIIAESGSYGYTGYDVNLIAPKKLLAESGVYGYTGYDVTLSTTAESRWVDLEGDPAGPWNDL